LTRPDKAAPPVPDLVKRDFTAPAINDKWCGDLTEVPTDEGKLYLATVEDLASKRIVGFGLSEHHDAELATAALKMAVTVRGGDVAGTIFHSDRGSEGGIRQSSQQLDSEELRWVFGSVSRRSVRCVVQCGRLVGRRGGGVSTVSASGRRSLAGVERGGGSGGRGGIRGGHPVVPSRWWHADDQSGPAVGALLVLRRARRDRHLARAVLRGARDRSQLAVDGAFPVENVPARVAARRTGIRRGWGGIGRCRWVGRVPGHRRQAAGVALREQESVGCAGHCSTNLASRARMSLASATI
jgi:Integrase core domain